MPRACGHVITPVECHACKVRDLELQLVEEKKRVYGLVNEANQADTRAERAELQVEELKKWIRSDGHNHCEPNPESYFWDDCSMCLLQKSEGKVWPAVSEKRKDEMPLTGEKLKAEMHKAFESLVEKKVFINVPGMGVGCRVCGRPPGGAGGCNVCRDS